MVRGQFPHAFLFLFFGVIAVGVVIAVFAYLANKRRGEALTAWAAAHGMSYTARDNRYRNMPWGRPFGTGSSRRSFDVVEGPWHGRPALCFSYRYKTQSGGEHSSTETHEFSLFVLRLPKALPELRVGREGLLGGLARAVGIRDIEFESEDFNKTFRVKSQDRRFASDVVNPRLMRFLLDSDAPGFLVYGPDIVLVRGGTLKADQIEVRLNYLEQVLGFVPGFVWEAR